MTKSEAFFYYFLVYKILSRTDLLKLIFCEIKIRFAIFIQK